MTEKSWKTHKKKKKQDKRNIEAHGCPIETEGKKQYTQPKAANQTSHGVLRNFRRELGHSLGGGRFGKNTQINKEEELNGGTNSAPDP